MDPLSISVSCITLITTITQVSVAVTNFVREVRDARGDLDAISRELVSLKSVLELLAEDTEGPHTATLPERLKDQIIDILKNCKHVVTDVEASLKKHSASRLGRAGHWAVGGGKGDMTKFRSSLETHKTALGLALDMVAITITRDIKDDTKEIRKDTAAIKDDTAMILEQIAQLQAQLPQNIMKDTSNHMLHRYLDDLSDFAELMSNPPEDELETLTIVDEDGNKTASSPACTPKDPEVSHRRPSSLSRQIYTEPSNTSTARNTVQPSSGVHFTSQTPERASTTTDTSRTRTLGQALAARQDDASQIGPLSDEIDHPPRNHESKTTLQGDDIQLIHQSTSMPSVPHQIQKPNPVVRYYNSPWANPYARNPPAEDSSPRMHPFAPVLISPWARLVVANSKQQPATSSAPTKKVPVASVKETGPAEAKEEELHSNDTNVEGMKASGQIAAAITKANRQAAKPASAPKQSKSKGNNSRSKSLENKDFSKSATANAAKPAKSKGIDLRGESAGDKDRPAPVPAVAPKKRVKVTRTGRAGAWGFWGGTSKKASSWLQKTAENDLGSNSSSM
ncbi:hypothetical protein HBI67_141140 [Parastagonospora nodorum]|nr:hypothetical protein HBI67_141140 [Parastagonospora nodorum]KAH6066515.1 hypothetical protein HBI66_158920 [Parastagonospora nodorum]